MKSISKKKWYRWMIALFVGIFLFGTVSTVFADSLDPDHKGSLSITLMTDEGQAVSGAELMIYHVASIDSNGQYQYTDSFSGASTPITAENLEGIRPEGSSEDLYNELVNIAEGLGGFDYGATTGADGKAETTNMDLGIYMIVQANKVTGFTQIEPTLVAIPQIALNESYVYDISVSPKVSVESTTPTIDTVVAIDDVKSTDDAPATTEKTTVNVVDTVTLENLTTNTNYTLEGELVDITDTDSMIEADSAAMKFTPSLTSTTLVMDFGDVEVKSGHTYVVYERLYLSSDTSTAVAEHTDNTDYAQMFTVTSPGTTTTPTPTPTTTNPPTKTTNTPGKPANHVTTLEKTVGKLPQTGQLWWPLPLLIAAGAALIIGGCLMKKKKH